MAEYLLSQRQFELINSKIMENQKIELAKKNWENFNEEQKELTMSLVEAFYPKRSKVLSEAWYNTVMDFLGIIDPTPVVDIVNSISYFSQGDTLYGLLTLIGAVPLVGDFVSKPMMAAAKAGSGGFKSLDKAIKLMRNAPVGSKEYKAAEEIIEKLAKEPGMVGTLLQKMSGPTGQRVVNTLDELPLGPLSGLKNTMSDYLKILTRAGSKGEKFQSAARGLAADFKLGKASIADVQKLKDLLKTEKVFDVATLSKPGFFSNVFFGGIPRIFRSPEGRRIRILMGQTKWWLGFLDYVGLGNFVGPEEISSAMSDEEFQKRLEEYNKTPEAKQYYMEQFGGEQTAEPQLFNFGDQKPPDVKKTSASKPELDPMAGFFRNMLMGKLNPIPGM